MSPLIAATILTFVALIVPLAGWRWSRALRPAAHPHCARCNHDLFGLPETSERCPECGSDLLPPGAVIAGTVTRHGGRLVLTGVGALVVASTAIACWRSVDWPTVRMRTASAAKLTADMAAGGPVGSAAAQELARRVDAGRYEGEELAAVARAFRPVIARARPNAVAGEALAVDVQVTPPISITVGISDWPERPRYVVYDRLAGYRVGEGEWVDRGHPFGMGRPLRTHDSDSHDLPLPATLAPGPATLRLKYEFVLVRLDDLPEEERGRAVGESGFYQLPDYRKHFPVAHAWEREVAVSFTVLPPGSNDVQLVSGATSRPSVVAAVKLAELDRPRYGDPAVRGVRLGRDRQGRIDLRWGLEFIRPPVGMAFEVSMRHPVTGQEVRLSSVSAGAGSDARFFGGNPSAADAMTLESWAFPTVDLVLRPSPATARKTVGLQQIWGEEVVLKDVPVLRGDPQSQPSE